MSKKTKAQIATSDKLYRRPKTKGASDKRTIANLKDWPQGEIVMSDVGAVDALPHWYNYREEGVPSGDDLKPNIDDLVIGEGWIDTEVIPVVVATDLEIEAVQAHRDVLMQQAIANGDDAMVEAINALHASPCRLIAVYGNCRLAARYRAYCRLAELAGQEDSDVLDAGTWQIPVKILHEWPDAEARVAMQSRENRLRGQGYGIKDELAICRKLHAAGAGFTGFRDCLDKSPQAYQQLTRLEYSVPSAEIFKRCVMAKPNPVKYAKGKWIPRTKIQASTTKDIDSLLSELRGKRGNKDEALALMETFIKRVCFAKGKGGKVATSSSIVDSRQWTKLQGDAGLDSFFGNLCESVKTGDTKPIERIRDHAELFDLVNQVIDTDRTALLRDVCGAMLVGRDITIGPKPKADKRKPKASKGKATKRKAVKA